MLMPEAPREMRTWPACTGRPRRRAPTITRIRSISSADRQVSGYQPSVRVALELVVMKVGRHQAGGYHSEGHQQDNRDWRALPRTFSGLNSSFHMSSLRFLTDVRKPESQAIQRAVPVSANITRYAAGRTTAYGSIEPCSTGMRKRRRQIRQRYRWSHMLSQMRPWRTRL
jgi:hypothetical protein